MMATTLLLLLVLAGSGLFVAAVLGVLGYSLATFFSPFPLIRGLGEVAWSSSADFVLVAVPMFIMMGELLLRSGITDSMYKALDRWVGHVPGGLMHTNIAASAVFAATSGSSIATAATIGTVSIPNMERFGYKPSLFLGSIAAGGTLGILIPPSINMVLYGAMSDTAVGDLYLAGLIPGLLMACLFSLYIYLRCKFDRSLAPNGERARWTQRLRALIHLVPPALLFLLVVGSIYAGLATATEASALGVIGSLVLVIVRGRLNLALLLRSFEGTVRTTAMVMAIVIAAYFLNFVLSTLGLTDAAVKWVGELGWSPIAVLLAIIVLYVFLGCFVESLTLMIATTPIVVPIIVQLGFSPVWFGVVFVILIETALITPPIGMNLFVVQSVRKSGPFRDVVMGSLPFVVLMFLIIVALIVFPDLALWLPSAFAASRA
ncbi:MAG: TRAP transporter large permease [Rhodoferax sp.]|nr:TRAP transporter large permease [Rhodoferax sp.]MCB2039489.1 TRAP transporter large permease [Rhodoferax sp.]MCP5263605.1 TRAP transporter large permease [Rhodoferax sp.]MCW5627962.1 TRAP transporter large permease [Rhodoferax sp.]